MQITVKLFAILKERAGVSSIILDLPEGSTAAVAADKVIAMHPNVTDLLVKCAFAVNRSYGSRVAVLYEGDELALIPPVSGGAEG
jgi:molybdopterin converting factor subunit 1